MKFVISLCFVTCLIASLDAAAVGPSTVQPKAADENASTTTAAPTAASDVIEECHQPKETGRCFALFYRYAYNVESRQCEEFIYGGCNGNQNNFESKEACEKKCLGRSEDGAKEEASTTPAKASDEEKPVIPAVGVVPAVVA
ncbi:putative Kunitz-type serine protease inhibitor [Anastrepha obliqua]|uniref:putative Kunitz-type serine protease inhibitor n=1 Tax=Anastrepha obliqua TaxID=95512 RepID=UPI002409780B|nr:putative Kunitz-type serine protease inhibitor [Anastrepha obliqua]